jgi:DNA-binding NarL/FixJ family response regulator
MSSNLSRRLTQVAIVEDHPEFREALSQVVSACPGMQLLEVCKDLPAGLSLLQRTCPDVLLVDLGLPSGSGLQLIRLARRQWGPRCTSAVLTVTGNEEHLVGAVAAGAKGYLFKSDQPEDWCRALMDLSAGRSPLHATMALSFSKLAAEASQTAPTGKAAASGAPGSGFDTTTQALLQHIAAGYTPQEAAHKLNLDTAEAGERIRSVYDCFAQGVPELSPRELELLQLLNKGYTFKQCAELMGVGESTTKTQAARAYEKLGASNLQTALYEARQAGLIT